jgi:hypothetical protein
VASSNFRRFASRHPTWLLRRISESIRRAFALCGPRRNSQSYAYPMTQSGSSANLHRAERSAKPKIASLEWNKSDVASRPQRYVHWGRDRPILRHLVKVCGKRHKAASQLDLVEVKSVRRRRLAYLRHGCAMSGKPDRVSGACGRCCLWIIEWFDATRSGVTRLPVDNVSLVNPGKFRALEHLLATSLRV